MKCLSNMIRDITYQLHETGTHLSALCDHLKKLVASYLEDT